MPKSPSLSWRGETVPVSATGDEQERTGAEGAGASCFSHPQLGLDLRQKGVFLMWRQEGTTHMSIKCPAAAAGLRTQAKSRGKQQQDRRCKCWPGETACITPCAKHHTRVLQGGRPPRLSMPSPERYRRHQGQGIGEVWGRISPYGKAREGCGAGCRSLCLPACGARRQCLPQGAPHAAAPLCPRTLLGGGGELPAGKGKQEHEHSSSPLLKLRHSSWAELTPF